MNRKFVLYSLLTLLTLVPMACGSLNQMTPAPLDDAAIEAEVRAKIAEDVTSKTFAVEVDVNDGVVTLSGHAANADDKRKIGQAANDVEGVKSVINNIHVQ
jgi:osmotically-inducible protein OsmY